MVNFNHTESVVDVILIAIRISLLILLDGYLERGAVQRAHEQLAVLVGVVVVRVLRAGRLLAQHLHQLLGVPGRHQVQGCNE